MKTKLQISIWTISFILLSACGKDSPVRVSSRELDPPSRENGSGQNWIAFPMPTTPDMSDTTAVLVNAMASLSKEVLSKKAGPMTSTLIGQAVPQGMDPLQMQRGVQKSKVYEKRVTNLIGLEVLLLQYEISYQYISNPKGSYLTNVKFTPLKVDTLPGWSVSASAVSEVPVNIGTRAAPVAQLRFSVTFHMESIGTSTSVTDQFEVEALKGEIRATIRDL